MPKTLLRLSALLFLPTLTLAQATQSPMLAELKADKISIVLAKEIKKTNPLNDVIRPTKCSKATEYEFHSLAEIKEDGSYPIYKWELVSNLDAELAMYDDGSIFKESFYTELDEKQKERFELNLALGLIAGALTKTTLDAKLGKERFLIIGDKNLYPLSLENKEAPTTKHPRPTGKEPYGIPVPGRKGYLYSPPQNTDSKTNTSWIIDAVGIDPGTPIYDPYVEGRIILVP